MMLCAIYRSPKRDQMYLYIRRRDDFSCIPETLLTHFGKPQFVMMLALDQHKKLAFSSIENVKKALQEQGFYLQMPPPPENWLEEEISSNNLKRN